MSTSPDLIDPSGRQIKYLRVSVTDRCDLRCNYCLPNGFKDFQEPDDWLNFDEITRVIAAFARLGATQVRLTGGDTEPTGAANPLERQAWMVSLY